MSPFANVGVAKHASAPIKYQKSCSAPKHNMLKVALALSAFRVSSETFAVTDSRLGRPISGLQFISILYISLVAISQTIRMFRVPMALASIIAVEDVEKN